MTGRENSEEHFENQWKEAFDQFEADAPKSVWSGIDRELAYMDLLTYKSKVVYYRWAAAVVLIVASAVVMVQHYTLKDKVRYVTYVTGNASWPYQESFITPRIPLAVDNQDNSTFRQMMGAVGQTLGLNSNDGSDGSGFLDDEEPIASGREIHVIKSLKPEAVIASTVQDKFLYFLPIYNFDKKRKEAEKSRYWAGVGVGSGSFNPNYQAGMDNSLTSNLGIQRTSFSSVSDEVSNNVSPSVREDMTPGESITMGLNFGLNLGSRWTLEGGVQYARADAVTKTNVVVETTTYQEVIPATVQGKNIPAFQDAVAKEAVVEYDYRDVNMNNQFEFTSVPVKAGYLVVDKRFRLEVNAGVVANIYMGNRLSSDDNTVASLTIGAGSTSPYRDLSFSGLAGLEFGYEFVKNFDIIVEPNYRQSINSLTKDNTSFSSNPSGFGLMTGLRYYFH